MTFGKLIAPLFIFVFIITATTTAASVFAVTNIMHGDAIFLPEDEVIEEDYFAAGEQITLTGTINGDAYVAGGNIFIEGTVNGDLLVAGGAVNIIGSVTNDLRVAGGQIIISGDIGGNVTSLGGSVNYTDSATVGGSVVNASGALGLFAPVEKGATIASGDATLGSTIGGNVTAGVENLTLNPKAQVAGDLNYWSSNEANIQTGALVRGQTMRNEVEKREAPEIDNILGTFSTGFRIISFLSTLVIGFLLLKFTPNFMQKTADTAISKPFKSLGIGLLTVIVTPIIAVLLMITIIGIPLGALTLISYFILLYFAKIFVSLSIGKVILRARTSNIYLVFTLGLVVYSLFRIVPILGFITAVLTVFIGTGAYLSTKHSIFKTLREKKLI